MSEIEKKPLSLDTYISSSKKTVSVIEESLDILYQNFVTAWRKNKKIIIDLINSDSNFVLIDRFGSFINIMESEHLYETDMIIELNNNRYFNLYTGYLMHYVDDPDLTNPYLSIVIGEDVIRSSFKDIEFYKDMMHIVGLNGLLTASLQYQKNILEDIQSIL